MSKHTPGPWSSRIEETATIRDAQDNQLAIFTHIHTKTGGRRYADEVAANTRLAAAAPDLLEACRLLVKFCDENPPAGEALYCVALARAAIAKAEGAV